MKKINYAYAAIALFTIIIMIIAVVVAFSLGERENDATETAKGNARSNYNVLFLGKDDAAGLSDVIMLASFNTQSGDVSILQIPRDTYFNYTDGSYKKINGAPRAITNAEFSAELSKALNIDVDYYFEIKLSTVKKIVDAISGVEIDVPMNMDYDDPSQGLSIHLKEGKNLLSGEDAIKFIRFRSGYLTGDIGRLDAQKLFLNAFVKRIGEQKNPITLLNIFKLIFSESSTNITEQELVSIGMKSSKPKGGKVYYVTAPGEAVQSEESGAWYYVLSRSAMQELMISHFGASGEKTFDNEYKFVDKRVKSFYDIYNKHCPYKLYSADEIENNQININ